jgi:multidrug resistance protein
MQSFVQYRRLGKALEVQLGRDREKISQLRQQQRVFNNGKENRSPADEKDLEAGRDAESNDDLAQGSDANDDISLESVSSQESTDGHSITRDDIERAEIPDDVNFEELRVIPTHQTTGTMLGHAMSGIVVRQRTTREGGPEAGDVFVVSWESAEDPLDPKNWGFAKRIGLTFIISLIGGVVGFAAAVDSAVIPEAADEFGVTQIIEALATGLFLIGFGFGGLVAGPFSETVGRNPIYITTMILYMLFLVGAGASPNIQSQLVCRFFAGIFGATPLVCAGGSLSDIWTPQERVFSFPLFACFSFLGPLLGPLVGDWIGESSAISWRWTEWVTLIASGVILAIVCLIQPETYAPVLLGWKAKHLRRLTNDERFRGAIEIRDTPLAVRLGRALYRPFLMMVQEPILVLFGLYLTVVYIVLFTFFTGYTYIFTDIYGLSQGMTGVCFIGEMVGILSCSALIPLNMHLRKRDIARAKALGPDVTVAPESRLYWAMIGGPVIPISLFWMGWTARADISIWSPLVASGFFGFGVLCVFMTTYQYLMDTYEVYAASALAGITFIRYTVSGAFIEISLPFYENMGVAYTLTILGSLSGVLVLIPYAFYRYGPAIRKRSKYVME